MKKADAELIAKEYLHAFLPSELSKKEKKAAHKRVVGAINEMREIEPAKYSYDDIMIFLPELHCRYYEENTDNEFSIEADAMLVGRSELWRASHELCCEPGMHKWTAHLHGCCYAFDTWKKTLGHRVWLGGFIDGPTKLHADGSEDDLGQYAISRRGRYQFLAAIIDEMLECGWTKKEQKKNAKDVKAKLLQAKAEREAKAKPNNTVYFDWSTVRAKLGLFSAEELGLNTPLDSYINEHHRTMKSYARAINKVLHQDFLSRANSLENTLAEGMLLDTTPKSANFENDKSSSEDSGPNNEGSKGVRFVMTRDEYYEGDDIYDDLFGVD